MYKITLIKDSKNNQMESSDSLQDIRRFDLHQKIKNFIN
jgi:hypothetical protein